MDRKELLSRLSGISTPVFGVSWTPTETEVRASRRILTFLEERRVLYNPTDLEHPAHCIDSVLSIREFLTDELGKTDQDSKLADNLQAMRAACRKFIDSLDGSGQANDYIGVPFRTPHAYRDWVFYTAIGDLRSIIGLHVALIAVRNGLRVDKDLASIVPGEPTDDGSIHLPSDLRPLA
jgi:hypothetical protein